MLVLPAFTWQTSHRTAMLPMCNQTSTSWRKVGPQHTLLSHGWKLHYLQILTTDQLNTHYFHMAESFMTQIVKPLNAYTGIPFHSLREHRWWIFPDMQGLWGNLPCPVNAFSFSTWKSAYMHQFLSFMLRIRLQWLSKLTVDGCSLTNCVWAHFPYGSPHYVWTA